MVSVPPSPTQRRTTAVAFAVLAVLLLVSSGGGVAATQNLHGPAGDGGPDDETVQRFVDLWLPRLLDVDGFQAYLDADHIPADVLAEGFHDADDETRTTFVAALVDELLRREPDFFIQPGTEGVVEPPSLAELTFALQVGIFEKDDLRTAMADGSDVPTRDDPAPSALDLVVRDLAARLPRANADGPAAPALPAPTVVPVDLTASTAAGPVDTTPLNNLRKQLSKLIGDPPSTPGAGTSGTVLLCLERTGAPSCQVTPLGVPVLWNVAGTSAPDVQATVSILPGGGAGDVSLTLTVDNDLLLGNKVAGHVFAVLDETNLNSRIAFGFDGRASTLSDLSTLDFTVNALQALQGNVDASLDVTHAGAGSDVDVTFVHKKLNGGVESDPTAAVLDLTPMDNAFHADAFVTRSGGVTDATVGLSGAPGKTLDVGIVTVDTGADATKDLLVTAQGIPTPLQVAALVSNTGAAEVHYDASTTMTRLAYLGRSTPSNAAPTTYDLTQAKVQGLPADVDVFVDPTDFELQWRASGTTGTTSALLEHHEAGSMKQRLYGEVSGVPSSVDVRVEKYGTATRYHYQAASSISDVLVESLDRRTYGGHDVSLDVHDVPTRVDLDVDGFQRSIAWDASGTVGSAGLVGKLYHGGTWNLGVNVQGIPARWEGDFALDKVRFAGLSGPIGLLSGHVTNHGTYTTNSGDHLTARQVGSRFDGSFQISGLREASFTRVDDGFDALLRLPAGSDLRVDVLLDRAAQRSYLDVQFTDLPNQMTVSHQGDQFDYVASGTFDVLGEAGHGIRGALANTPTPPTVHGLAVRDGFGCTSVVNVLNDHVHSLSTARVEGPRSPTPSGAAVAPSTLALGEGSDREAEALTHALNRVFAGSDDVTTPALPEEVIAALQFWHIRCGTAVKATWWLTGFPKEFHTDADTRVYDVVGFAPSAHDHLELDVELDQVTPVPLDLWMRQDGIPRPVDITIGPLTQTDDGVRVTTELEYAASAGLGRLDATLDLGGADADLLVSNIPASLHFEHLSEAGTSTARVDASNGIDRIRARAHYVSGSNSFAGGIDLRQIPSQVELTWGKNADAALTLMQVPGPGGVGAEPNLPPAHHQPAVQASPNGGSVEATGLGSDASARARGSQVSANGNAWPGTATAFNADGGRTSADAASSEGAAASTTTDPESRSSPARASTSTTDGSAWLGPRTTISEAWLDGAGASQDANGTHARTGGPLYAGSDADTRDLQSMDPAWESGKVGAGGAIGHKSGAHGVEAPGFLYNANGDTLDVTAWVDAELFGGDVTARATLDAVNVGRSTSATLSGTTLSLSSAPSTTKLEIHVWATWNIDAFFEGCKPSCSKWWRIEYGRHFRALPMEIRDFYVIVDNLKWMTVNLGITSSFRGDFGNFQFGWDEVRGNLDAHFYARAQAWPWTITLVSPRSYNDWTDFHVKFHVAKNVESLWKSYKSSVWCGHKKRFYLDLDLRPTPAWRSWDHVSFGKPGSSEGHAWLVTPNPAWPGGYNQILPNVIVEAVAGYTSPAGGGIDASLPCKRK